MNQPFPAAHISFDPRDTNVPPPSPCVSLCQMDAASGLCAGCQRNIDEIALWSGATDTAKRAIWRAINQRRDSAGAGSRDV